MLIDAEAGWAWRVGVVPPGPAVVVDLDGVIADATHRQYLVTGGRRDWDQFFAACGGDALIEEAARLVDLLAPELAIVLLTGRPIGVRAITLEWLERVGVRWDVLLMREGGDYRAARSFKRRSVVELRAWGFDLRLAVDDDLRNCEMFRAEGLACVYFHSGYYG